MGTIKSTHLILVHHLIKTDYALLSLLVLVVLINNFNAALEIIMYPIVSSMVSQIINKRENILKF